MASLENVKVKDSYTSLLKLSGNTDTLVAGNNSNAIQVVDGNGDASPLYLNTDRLGIGGQPEKTVTISSANAQLHIKESDAGTNLKNWLFNAEGGVLYYQTLTDALGGGSTYLQVNRTEQTVTSVSFPTGNIGIGVVPETTNSAASALQIGGNGYFLSTKAQGASGEMDLGYNFYWSPDGNYKYISTDEASMIRQGGGNIRFRTAPSGSADATATFTERMTITQAGNVGIGIASPDNTLHVFKGDAGSVAGTDGATTPLVIENNNHNFIQFLNPSDKQAGLYFGSPSENYYHGTIAFDEANERLVFEVDAVKKLVVDANSRISLSNNDSGSNNTIFGKLAGVINSGVSGDNNVYIGENAGKGNTTYDTANTADKNTAIGYNALPVVQNCHNNTAIGYNSQLANARGQYNTSLGGESLKVTTETTKNTAIGYESLRDHQQVTNNGVVEEAFNTALGFQSIHSTTTGIKNTGLGASTAIDVDANNQTVIGYGATSASTGANTVVLGNADVTSVHMSSDSQAYVHAQNVPNHVANTMSSPYYRFDGTNDQIDIADNANIDLSTALSIECLFKTETNSSVYQELVNKADAAQSYSTPYKLAIDNSGLLNATVANGSASNTAVTSSQLTTGQWYHVVFTADGSNLKLYLNGTLIDTESQTITPETQSGILSLGGWGTNGGEYNHFHGEMQKVSLWNKSLTTTEIKQLYSGASVPFKYKGANQTSLVTGASSDMSGAGSWNFAYLSGSNNNSTVSGKMYLLGNANDDMAFIPSLLTIGKAYSFSLKARLNTGASTAIRCGSNLDNAGAYVEFTPTGTEQTFTGTFVANQVELQIGTTSAMGGMNGKAFEIDDVLVYPVGAVAEYDGSSAGSKVWGDKSGNDLHGTVGAGTLDATAPTLENTPYDSGTEYEEGTFTPTIDGIDSNLSYATQTGFYTKIGNQVSFNIYMATSTGSGGAKHSDQVKLMSLPFTSSATSSHFSAVAIGKIENVNNDDADGITGLVNTNSTEIHFFKSTGANFIGTDMDTAGVVLMVSGTYFTD